MSEEKFTPGPWRTNNDCDQVITAYEPTLTRTDGYRCHNNFVADLNDGEYHEYYDHEEQKANAHLISCAPEMYEQLKKFHEVFENECCISCSRCHELRDEAEALLKKARGEE